MPANTTYSIYVLMEPSSDIVRYVGISCNTEKRMSEHLKEKRLCHRVNWVQSLISNGLYPKMEIIEEGLDNKKIFELKLKGYTQKQIAEQLNCNPSNISRILNNKYKHKNI